MTKRFYLKSSTMRTIQFLLALLLTGILGSVHAHVPKNFQTMANQKAKKANFRDVCANSESQIDQEINNVRARLLGGGDCWWDFNDGRYIVPKVDVTTGQREVSSIFAGSVWLGGIDPGRNLKLACMDYRNGTNNDFWPGPLTPEGITESFTCSNWDRHFRVTGDEIREHLRNLASGNTDENAIPRGVRGWPAKGNPFFSDVWGFDLPNTPQALAGFYDAPGPGGFPDGLYNPLDGDYPSIEIRGCPLNRYPDEMIFWIYNDQGGGQPHNNTLGAAIQMEVQVQAFGYVTNDELNDMTFQRYKLINRAVESIDSTFFAMWVDPDLGCYVDDYIGCDTARSLMFVYNQDATDGDPGCACPQGVATYCDKVPILGVDYFRGPVDTILIIFDTIPDPSGGDPIITVRDSFVEIGMSSFTYYNNGGVGTPEQATTDPSIAIEFYRYLTGSWRDGTPFTFGGSGYNPNNPAAVPVKYAFTDAPDDPTGWSMCTQALPFGDRRTIQASGPFYLDPGEVNELIVGVPWVPDIDYPCPSLDALFRADQLAQGLFDNCFELTDGPDAPTVDWIELNKQFIAVLTNDSLSNNFKEAYAERDIFAPTNISDSLASYRFEGYIIYQLVNPNVSSADFEGNPDVARIIAQVDVKNDVRKIYNWVETRNPNSPDNELVYYPVLKADGADLGIKHTFSLTEDAFATGNVRSLINHKKYYYAVVAYAYNDYEAFDPLKRPITGQTRNYLVGRRGTQIYTVIPRPIVDQVLQSSYGEEMAVTRLEGRGASPGVFLELSKETQDKLFTSSFDSVLVYNIGQGPIKVNIFNPFEVRDGTYELSIVDENPNDDKVSNNARWQLRRLPDGAVVAAERTLEEINEQIVSQYGFSVNISQPEEPGERPTGDNGAIGGTVTYAIPDSAWMLALSDDAPIFPPTGALSGALNYIRTGRLEDDEAADPNQRLSTLAGGWFAPYSLAFYQLQNLNPGNFVISPAWIEAVAGTIGSNNNQVVGASTNERRQRLARLNNVDIVMTNDKSKWSRCVVVESASLYYTGGNFVKDPALRTESPTGPRRRIMFDSRFALPVGKDDLDNDGLPDPDGSIDPVSNRPMYGMGWFPGYAIDVETGTRLNIFFGENSTYSRSVNPAFTGRDMLFNPTSSLIYENFDAGLQYYNLLLGGQHMVYVTDQPYDSCRTIWRQITPDLYNTDFQTAIQKRNALRNITWAGMFMLNNGFTMRPLSQGLIPSDVTVKLRVNNRYDTWYKEEVDPSGNLVNKGKTGHPKYQFTVSGREAYDITADKNIVNNALDSIKVVPNPYYGFSEYETSQFANTVKITNLPGKCVVSIYSLDGKFIRQYNRNEVYAPYNQITPALEWDLRNNKGIPVASGVYLIHIDAPGLGRRTIKWFGVARQFDPSGL